MGLNEIFGISGGVTLIILTLLQIAPVKINPWSWLARAVGRAINGELMADVKAIRADVDQNEIDRIRWEILDFSNSCYDGKRHSKEEFDHVIALNEKYHKLLKRRGETNGQLDLAYAYIEQLYKKCQLDGDFL